MKHFCLAVTALATLIAVPDLARAGVIFNNILAAPAAGDSVVPYGPLYASFSTDSTSATLSDVELFLLVGNPDSLGAIDIGLYSDDDTSPGTEIALLGTLDDSSLTTSPEIYDISLASVPPEDLILSPNSRYWIGLSNDPDDEAQTSAGWAWSSDISGQGVASEYYALVYPSTLTVNPNTFEGGYQMLIATSPEPGTVVQVLSGLCLALVLRLGKSRASAG
jgi:hypothetical protein